MKVESRYKPIKRRLEVIKNGGFDYRNRILVNSIDNNLFKNATLRGYLIKVEKVLTNWFIQTRKIKLFRQIALDKDDESIMNL